MAYLYPYGNTQQLNLDWLVEQWNEVKSQIDGSLQAEIDRVEAAITDLLTARDEAVAARDAAALSASAAASSANTASGAASAANAQALAAAGSAATAGSHSSNAQGYALTAQQEALAANNSASAAAVSEGNARNSETAAAGSSSAAAGNALYAEGYAKGTQNGTPVTSGSPYYENNAKYYADQAAQEASDAADSAQDAHDVLDSIPADYSALQTTTTQNTDWLMKSTPDADVKKLNPNISNLAVNGATANYSNGKLAVYGTCAATRYILCLDSQAVAKSGSGTFEKTLDPGEYYISFKASGNIPAGYTPLVRYSKSTFTADRTDVHDNEIIKVDVPVMLAITIQAANYGTSDNPTYFELEVFNINEPAIKKINVLNPTNDTTNRTDEILACLNKYGICRLAEGDYYITRFKLPDNVVLIGSGKNKTRLISTTDPTSAYVLNVGNNSTIADITLEYYTAVDPTPTATYKDALHGIVIGSTASSDTSAYNVSIENVEIKKMPGCGIFLRRIGNGNNGSTIRNIKATLCSVGFYIGTNAEYNTLTNCYATRCYTGMIVMGGNNIVSESIVSECEHGFIFNKTDDYGSANNTGHSIITGCKISHMGYYDNNGLSIKSEGLANSQIIANCMMTTNIYVKDADQPIQFVGCQFRSANNITVDNSIVATMSCMYYSGTNVGITIANGGILKRVGSTDFSGNLLSDVNS